MNRRTALSVLLLGGLGPVGCRPSGLKPPGQLTRAELESRLKEELGLTELSLSEESKGTFSGSGTRTDGAKCELKVSQSEKEIRTDWTDDRGGHGNSTVGWSSR